MNALRKNNAIRIVALALGLSMAVASTSFAETKSSASSSTHSLLWFGVSTDSLLIDPAQAAFVPLNTLPSVSLLFRITDKFVLQSYTLISGIKPSFTMGAGASAKVTLIGNFSKGFHIGGGFGMGDMGAGFYTNIGAIAGFHFEVVNDVLASVDTGIRMHIGGGRENFSIAGASQMLGLSLHFGL